jgi:mRNA deadenylase 3'-5' endonuclease subunit Ccr4
MQAHNPSFVVATYNVLASAYIQRARYPRSPAMVLTQAWRAAALVQQISSLEADIFCLQEVEPQTLAALNARLGSRGYSNRYARKSGGGAEGCATFYRQDLAALSGETVIRFADGLGAEPDTGSIALITIHGISGYRLGIINTHLTWDPPGTAREHQRGLRQVNQLLREYEKIAAAADDWMIAGDLNVIPGSEIVSLIERTGFRFAHAKRAEMCTCSFNGEVKMIDYLFHSPRLRARPIDSFAIDARTVLPSAEQPSDHVPVIARFDWKI